jgi:uncharacterized protein YbgA (DUF1722 family)
VKWGYYITCEFKVQGYEDDGTARREIHKFLHKYNSVLLSTSRVSTRRLVVFVAIYLKQPIAFIDQYSIGRDLPRLVCMLQELLNSFSVIFGNPRDPEFFFDAC